MGDEPDRQPVAYHILQQIGGQSATPTFKLVDHVRASSAAAAIRTHAETRDDENGPGTYIAVPSRSWKPVTVTAETKTVLKLS